jgi:hypothetical protein
VRPWKQSAQQWLDFFIELRQHHFATGQGPAPLASLADDARWASTRSFTPEPPAWYASSYLEGLPPPDTTDLPANAWLPYLPAPDAGQAARGRALGALARLRALPVLAPLARAIPLRWQVRVKNWLSR